VTKPDRTVFDWAPIMTLRSFIQSCQEIVGLLIQSVIRSRADAIAGSRVLAERLGASALRASSYFFQSAMSGSAGMVINSPWSRPASDASTISSASLPNLREGYAQATWRGPESVLVAPGRRPAPGCPCLDLVVEGLGEIDHECFSSAVDAVEQLRAESDDRGDIDDEPLGALKKPGRARR